MQFFEQRIVERLGLRSGGKYLDVGCGTGDDVRAMAQQVGTDGWIVGVDSSETMIAEAARRSEGVSLPIEFRLGRAEQLEFADATFDGSRCERVLQHVADPSAVLTEMVRVTRVGGRIVCLEPDWETLVVDAPDRATTRAILNFRCDSHRNGWIGRQLPAPFSQAGLEDVLVELLPQQNRDFESADAGLQLRSYAARAAAAGVVRPEAAAAWVRSLEDSSAAGLFFQTALPFLVSARKP